MSEDTKKLIEQNEVIISLLSRLVIKPEEIRKIVTFKKQNPENYIKGYNLCDGKHTVTEIATVVGVKQPTLSPILIEWEEKEIIREIEKPGGKFYKKIYAI